MRQIEFDDLADLILAVKTFIRALILALAMRKNVNQRHLRTAPGHFGIAKTIGAGRACVIVYLGGLGGLDKKSNINIRQLY